MSTGPASFPLVFTDNAAVAVSLSVMFALADAVLIVTSPSEGFEIVASTVSVLSSSASSVTLTVKVPVDAPSATEIVPPAKVV